MEFILFLLFSITFLALLTYLVSLRGCSAYITSITETDAVVWFYPCNFVKYHYKFNPHYKMWYRKSGLMTLSDDEIQYAVAYRRSQEEINKSIKKLWSKK